MGEGSPVILGNFLKPNSFDGNSRSTRYSMVRKGAIHTVLAMKNRISSLFRNPLSREMPKYDSNALNKTQCQDWGGDEQMPVILKESDRKEGCE
jgi:hypothetical protein